MFHLTGPACVDLQTETIPEKKLNTGPRAVAGQQSTHRIM